QIKHDISVVIDRLVVKDGINKRLTDSVETALKLGNGLVIIDCDGVEQLFSSKYACPDCNISIGEIEPRLFSFNSPFGACPECSGLGFKQELDPVLIYGDGSKSLNEGALNVSAWNFDTSQIGQMYFRALSKHYGFSLDTPFRDLPKKIQDILLYGSDDKLDITYSTTNFTGSYRKNFEGVVNNLKRRFRESTSDYVKSQISRYMREVPCSECGGKRLKKEALAVTVGGLNIMELSSMPILKIKEFLSDLKLSASGEIIAKPIMREINARLNFLIDVGLGYLTLTRSASTLSGGEAQRIRLATQIGSGLTGVLYILDEPSIGLHQRDNSKLINTLTHLRDLGNTLIVVEHDEETMRSADFIVDVGPKAGVKGGEIVVAGTIDEVIACEKSLTGKYLSGEKFIPVPKQRRQTDGREITVVGARQNNLKNITVSFPVGLFTCVTGVSGSGKSSLVNQILYPALSNPIMKTRLVEGDCDKVTGLEHIYKVICIDQTPIGRTPRSNPATYTGVFTAIRELFAKTSDAQERGYDAGRFSFNVKGGRCENFQGDCILKVEMNFLPDVYVPCEVCGGKRYNRETLQVRYKGKNIYEVLEMTVAEACEFFENIPAIYNKISTLNQVGLGYIKLGQPATTLSGGEAQRVKLATELSKRSTAKTLYILDEPTTGLHIDDVAKLLEMLQ
ncbi:MAG: excinuclease ABC subunit UvrA, partial [Clostridia bacterium]|nr:excinuclease ABC subunit UvrA [Clostridia bacterium]